MFKPLFALSILALTALSAQAAERHGLLIYRNATNETAGVADIITSVSRDGTEVTLTTRSGNIVPVKYFDRLSATILEALANSGYSVDVEDCARNAYAVSTDYRSMSECSVTQYAQKYICGRLSSVETYETVDLRRFDIRDISKQPIIESTTRCRPHGARY